MEDCMENGGNQFQGVIESLLKGMNTVLSTKTVVGEATKIGDTIILPLVDVSFGVGAGAGNKLQKDANTAGNNSGSGVGGIGGKMTPSAVLVIQDGNVKLVNVKNQNTVTKVLDLVPDMVDKFLDRKDKNNLSDEQALDIAFPAEDDTK